MVSNHPNAFIIPASTALGVAENLIVALNTMIRDLPEPELRKVRAALEVSTDTADDILYNMMISSTFEMLSFNDASIVHGEAVPATVVSSSRIVGRTPAANVNVSGSTFETAVPLPSPIFGQIGRIEDNGPPVPRQTAVVRIDPPRVPTPAPTPDPIPAPTEREMIISSRPGVGIPDYTYHPKFVRPGIPGKYSSPPIDPEASPPSGYYVVTRGLYVGIFTNWIECSPWVIRVSGSNHCKVKQWTKAMNLYNASLAVGSCQVLS